MKKGFTLIELLAVIVILAVITLIAVPVILNVIKESEKGSFKDSAYGIMKSAENYYVEEEVKGNTDLGTLNISDLSFKGEKPDAGEVGKDKSGNIAIYMWKNSSKLCVYKNFTDKDVTLDETLNDSNVCKQKVTLGPILPTNVLITGGNQKMGSALNKQLSVTFEPSNTTIKTISWNSSNSSVATISNTGLVTAVGPGITTITATTKNGIISTVTVSVPYTNGNMQAYNNCVTTKGKICTTNEIKTGIEVRVKVNPTTTYNFNVLSDDGTKLVLIMDRNIKANDPDSLTEEGDVRWSSGSVYTTGPDAALAALATRTASWSNISFNYTLSGKTNTYVKYTTVNKTGVRARIINYDETISLDCLTGSGTCPAWMKQNTYNTGDATTQSYWTSAGVPYASSSTPPAAYIPMCSFSNYMKIDIADQVGIRPVIEINKI